MGDADLLLRRAHQAGYRFPHRFPGFSATLATNAGDRGRVVVRGRSEVEVRIDGAPSPDVDWARQQIASIVGHRWAADYADGDGRWAKQRDGEVVTILDDPFDSAYRLRDDEISEVHRTVGSTRFVIAVAARSRLADGRQLPTHFTVFYWDTGTGRLVRSEQYTDVYAEVGGVHLPACRRVVEAADAGITTRVLELSEHRVGPDA